MDKEFITYNQALALKELGFDEPCFFPYNKEGEICWNEKVFHNIQYQRYDFPIFDEKSIHYIGIRAPLYQQAFRWFREKYDLWCCIQKYPTSDNPKRCYYELKGDNINTDKDESPNSYMSGWFDSYEEAESACLDKLIEICKNK